MATSFSIPTSSSNISTNSPAAEKSIPASGALRWKVKSDHSLIQGMLDSMLLCRYENITFFGLILFWAVMLNIRVRDRAAGGRR